MAKKQGCLHFPFDEDTANQSLRHTTSINDTLKSSIRCFLITSPGQRRGNNVGSFLPTLKHQLLPTGVLKVSQEKLEQELKTQFPNINFEEVRLTMDTQDNVSNLRVRIMFSTSYTSVSELSFLL